MRRNVFIFIFGAALGFLTLGFFVKPVSAAADYACFCYYEDGHCEEYSTDSSQNDCEALCYFDDTVERYEEALLSNPSDVSDKRLTCSGAGINNDTACFCYFADGHCQEVPINSANTTCDVACLTDLGATESKETGLFAPDYELRASECFVGTSDEEEAAGFEAPTINSTPTNAAPKPQNPYELEIQLGNISEVKDLTQYITSIYEFAVGAAGIVATVMIMWGGMKWIFAAGESSKISDAKKTIMDALMGLILALGSYVFLNMINPALVELALPEVGDVSFVNAPSGGACGAVPDQSCPGAKTNKCCVEVMTDPLALEVLSAQSSANNMKRAVPQLCTVLETATIIADKMGMRLYYSTQRTLDTQAILYDCYMSKVNTGICKEGCWNNCPLAGKPECVEHGHGSGEAADVFWGPKDGSNTPYFNLTKISAIQECNGGACCGELNTAIDPATPYPCTVDEKDDVAISQKALQTVMIAAGASRHICPEYWHFDVSGLRGCDPGVYSSPKVGTIYDTSTTVITLPQ